MFEGKRTFLIDEAVVQLSPGMKWKAEIVEIGVVKDVHKVTFAEAQKHDYKVHKRGAVTRRTAGVISTFVAGEENGHGLYIVTSSAPGVPFVDEGDSGSVLLNEHEEVVGLIHHANESGDGIASPILQVLQRFADKGLTLEVAVATAADNPMHTVPGGARIAVPPEVAEELAADPGFTGEGGQAPVGQAWFSDEPAPMSTVDRVLDDLGRSAAGRSLVAFWERHGEELAGLPNGDRRFRVVWHRGGGSAFVQLLLRTVTRPERTLPVTLNGEPLPAFADRILEEVRRCASPALVADLDRLRADLPDPAGLSYQGIIDALAEGSEPDGAGGRDARPGGAEAEGVER